MGISKKKFGTMPDGEEVFVYILENKSGLRAEILNYGGIVKNCIVTDEAGAPVDVVLGRDSLEEYRDNFGYYGAAIGRHANRIAGAKFTLGGKIWEVGRNEGENSLHGGFAGFDKKIWAAQTAGTEEEPELVLSLFSPDGEEGFPGNLFVTITYSLTSQNALKIHYVATADQDTVVNLTNHSYFNLAGHGSGNIYKQILQLNAAYFTPNTAECLPDGEVLSVTGTPFDFRVPKPLGQDIAADTEQITWFGGYDHNFVAGGTGYRPIAAATCLDNGITMQVYSDQPGVQLYTTNGVEEGRACKDGVVYQPHQAFCLETQCFPNGMEHIHFPSPILKAGQVYDTTTEYRFSITSKKKR